MQIGAWRKNSLKQVAPTPGYSKADDDTQRELGSWEIREVFPGIAPERTN